MSSVVAMELRAGCRGASEVRILERLLRPFEAARRVIAPDHRACLRAGTALALLGSRLGLAPEKRRALSHDALIAASAVAIGAAVITRNRSDFALLAQCLPLVWFGSLEEFLAAERR
jgi:predicted nucleic acid-binding protein